LVVNIETIQHLLAKSIMELRKHFGVMERPVPEGFLEALERDPRNGAHQLAISIRKRRMKNRREAQRLHQLLCFEIELWEKGLRLIAGVDEAGMAPLAGPVVAAASHFAYEVQTYRFGMIQKKYLNECRRNELAAQNQAGRRLLVCRTRRS